MKRVRSTWPLVSCACALTALFACTRSHVGRDGAGPPLLDQAGAGTSGNADVPGVAGQDASGAAGSQAPLGSAGTAGPGGPDDAASDPDVAKIARDSSNAPRPPPPRAAKAPEPKGEWITVADLPAPSPQIAVEDGATVPFGTWTGTSRVGVACDGSAQITMLLAEPRDGEALNATVVFGSGPFPPSAVDPTREYPIGDDAQTQDCRATAPSSGFVYGALDGRIARSGRFSFRVAVAQPFASWCALQTSARGESATGYWCLPDESSLEYSACESGVIAACTPGKAALCSSGACVCVEDGCRANLNRTLAFDLQIRGDAMEGYISLLWEGAPIEVRLRRVD